MRLKNYVHGEWVEGTGPAVTLHDAVTGAAVAEATTGGLDFKGDARIRADDRRAGAPRDDVPPARAHAQGAGAVPDGAEGRALRGLGGDRRDEGRLVDRHRRRHRDVLRLRQQGPARASRRDVLRRRRPEPLSKGGTFVGRHICVPLEGVAVHINAFNFPCWGMLEKLAPTFLAGMPAIVKPATVTSFLTEAMVRVMIESGLLPAGALQLLCGSAGDLLDHLDEPGRGRLHRLGRDRAEAQGAPQHHQRVVRFNMEADSLNFSMLGPDAAPGTEEFDLFIKEVAREMTVKAGQKCTAIRRVLVPESMVERRDPGALEAARRRHARRSRRSRACAWDRSRRKDQVAEVREALDALRARRRAGVRRPRRLQRGRRGRGQGRVLPRGAAALRRSLRPERAARHRGVRSGEHASCPTRPWTTPSSWRSAGEGSLVRLALHGRRRRRPRGGARHGRVSRPAHAGEPPQREGVDRARLAAAAPGARRPGPRGRRRGDGRRARRASTTCSARRCRVTRPRWPT